MQQLANNTAEQAMLGDFPKAMDDATAFLSEQIFTICKNHIRLVEEPTLRISLAASSPEKKVDFTCTT